MNIAALNILVHIWPYVYISGGYIPRDEVAGSQGIYTS